MSNNQIIVFFNSLTWILPQEDEGTVMYHIETLEYIHHLYCTNKKYFLGIIHIHFTKASYLTVSISLFQNEPQASKVHTDTHYTYRRA